MKRIPTLLLLTALAIGLTGCTSVYNGVVSCETEMRDCILAQRGWRRWSKCYRNVEYPFHFGKGFRDGYRNILAGGNGCQPTLPPECYWKPQFQNPTGRCKTYAWFDGFSHGALAAKQDGYGSLGEIPISPRAKANMELARTPRTDMMYYPSETTVDPAPLVTPDGELIEVPQMPNSDTDIDLPLDGGLEVPAPVPPRPYE